MDSLKSTKNVNIFYDENLENEEVTNKINDQFKECDLETKKRYC